MMLTRTDDRSGNEALYVRIQAVYEKYFHPGTDYTCRLAYGNVENHGFVGFECREYPRTRVYSADEYVSWVRIMASQFTPPEPDKTNFLEGIRAAILNFGNKIVLKDTVVLYLARKP